MLMTLRDHIGPAGRHVCRIHGPSSQLHDRSLEKRAVQSHPIDPSGSVVVDGHRGSLGVVSDEIPTGSLHAVGPTTLIVVGAIALVATVLPIAAFLAGVRRIGPSRATILGTVEPPVTIALSALVFAERLGALQIVGAGLVLSGVLILQLRRRPTLRPVPQPAPAPGPKPIPDTERIAA